jgi:AcrR family transcriptional regulator
MVQNIDSIKGGKMKTKLPHEIKSEETKRKILDATKNMLSEYDFKFLTVRNICEQASVAYGSFYHHFSSKENLLFIYTKDLYEKVYEANPLPKWINHDDYVKAVMWYFVVYGYFCEKVGKKLIRYLSENCPQSIFDDTYERNITGIIDEAQVDGYLDEKRGSSLKDKKPEFFLIKDLRIIYKGVVAWWCSNDEGDIEDYEPLYKTLEHLGFNMLFSYSSEKYKNSDFPHKLITDMDEFGGGIVLDDINIKNDEN